MGFVGSVNCIKYIYRGC